MEGKANVGIHILPGEHEVHGLDYDSEYEFAIKAHNKIGWSLLGPPTESFGTLALEPPGKPRIITCTDTLATVEWDPPTLTGRPVDMYDLEVRRWRFEGGLYSPMEWVLVERAKEPCSLVRELMPTAIYNLESEHIHMPRIFHNNGVNLVTLANNAICEEDCKTHEKVKRVYLYHKNKKK